jgi:hypothetical protein
MFLPYLTNIGYSRGGEMRIGPSFIYNVVFLKGPANEAATCEPRDRGGSWQAHGGTYLAGYRKETERSTKNCDVTERYLNEYWKNYGKNLENIFFKA